MRSKYTNNKKIIPPIICNLEDAKKHPICLIAGKNGVFVSVNNPYYSLIADSKLDFLEDVEESLRFRTPEVSYKDYAKVLSFFREIHKTHRSEAMVLLYLKTDLPINKQDYKIVVPVQKVSAAGIKYDVPPQQENEILIGSIHSHPSFGASQSSTDSGDESGDNFEGVHITIGNVDKKTPTFHARFVARGKSYEIEVEDAINTLPNIGDVKVPKDWINQVSKNDFSTNTNSHWYKSSIDVLSALIPVDKDISKFIKILEAA